MQINYINFFNFSMANEWKLFIGHNPNQLNIYTAHYIDSFYNLTRHLIYQYHYILSTYIKTANVALTAYHVLDICNNQIYPTNSHLIHIKSLWWMNIMIFGCFVSSITCRNIWLHVSITCFQTSLGRLILIDYEIFFDESWLINE